MNKFKRKISPNERMYISFEKNYNSFGLNKIIKGIGIINLEKFSLAVKEIEQICPEINLRMDGNYWILSKKNVSIKYYEKNFDEDYRFLLDNKMDLKKGPLTEIIIFQGEKNYTLIFRNHHGIMDGKGQDIWIKKLFKILNGEKLEGKKSIVRDIDLLRKYGTKKNSDMIHIENYNPIADRKNFFITKPKVRKIILDKKIENITSKLMWAISKMSSQDKNRFIVTKDLREKFKNEEENIGNLSVPLYIDIHNENWEEIYQQLLKKILNEEELIYSKMEYKIFEYTPFYFLTKGLNYIIQKYNNDKKTSATSVISNLGKINLENYSTETFKALEVYSLPVLTPMVPLSFIVTEQEDKSILTLGYYENNYKEETIDKYIKNLKNILLNSEEVKIFGKSSEYDFDILNQILNHNSEIISKNKSYSLKALNEKSNSLGKYLKENGIKKGDKVILHVDRDENYIIGILTALKLGLVFIPLDTEYPEERINYIIKNSGSKVIILNEEKNISFEGLLKIYKKNILEMEYSEEIEREKIFEEDSLYIIYTSGSTGNPKGVEISYKTFKNYLDFCINNYKITSENHFGFFTSISFDLSLTAIFCGLLAGSKISMYEKKVTPMYLKEILENKSINSIKVTPTHLEIINSLNVSNENFKLIIVGGEQFKSKAAIDSQRLFGKNCMIINEYGPTEATVGCVYHIFTERDMEKEIVPIGIPIDNTNIYMDIDRETKEGELLIGGNCLSKGYVNNLLETRKRFLKKENSFYYKTGDICKVNSEGNLEFIERKDFQIKIRGYRIEIEEIERKIEGILGVDQIKILLSKSKTNLVGYYKGKITSKELKKELEKKLPEYMIPSNFIKLEEFPYTTNGKLDLQKIKELEKNEIVSYKKLSKEEIIVLKLWEEILDIKITEDKFYEDFYNLGADSLSMVRLINSLPEEKIKFHMMEIIKKPTIENIAKVYK